ncbi:uncharacterized protein [Miscanthus floridulus]|uniref:uncharacterized protein n=1 Tax=Miscanthus floridulus TaxID=154761 RepID=UPI003458AA38
MNHKIWDVVENDFVVIDPTSPTPREEEKLQFNDIAINTLYDALDIKVFEQIKYLERAHEVWTRLEESYEGTKAVKSAKLFILKDKLVSICKMVSIPEMFHRLQVIINDLKSLGEKVEDKDFSHEFLRCLPSRFDTLVTILVRDGLETMTPNQLLGDVVTQDTYHAKRDGVPQEEEKKKKGIAFKATTSSKSKGKIRKEESSDEASISSQDDEDEEVALFVR